MVENYNSLRKEMIEFLKIGGKLNDVYLHYGSKPFTKQQIITEIENGSEIGQTFINDLILLSLDLFNRKKENLGNFNREI